MATRYRNAPALALLALLAAGCANDAPPPSLGPRSVEPVTVIVQRGDTLSGLARQHGVPMASLASANGLASPYRIHPGQALTLPGAGRDARPAPTALAGAPPAVQVTASALGVPALAPAQGGASGPIPSRAVTAEPLPPPSAPVAAASPLPPPQGRTSAGEAPLAMSESLPAPRSPSAGTVAKAPAPEPQQARPAPRAAEQVLRGRRLPPGRFAWPVRGEVVSAFGAKGGGLVNDGLNIAAPRGTPIRAAADGTVIYAGNEVRGFGNLVLLRHDGGWVTAYGHADRILVRQGQVVRMGEEIARVGNTGSVATPQLHFQVRRDGRPVDPALHLDRAVATRGS